MNRRQRRAEVARFRQELVGGLVSYLVDATDPRLAGQPLLSGAVRWWRRNVPTRRPRCFGCRATLEDAEQAAAFLLVTPPSAATTASVSALCTGCWRDLSLTEIEEAATRALRRVTP